MVDREGRQVDVHPVKFDESGNGIYKMRTGEEWVYPAAGFAARGRVLGRQVRCLSPEVQMLAHTGYSLSDKDHQEIRALQEKFGVAPPPGYDPLGWILARANATDGSRSCSVRSSRLDSNPAACDRHESLRSEKLRESPPFPSVRTSFHYGRLISSDLARARETRRADVASAGLHARGLRHPV